MRTGGRTIGPAPMGRGTTGTAPCACAAARLPRAAGFPAFALAVAALPATEPDLSAPRLAASPASALAAATGGAGIGGPGRTGGGRGVGGGGGLLKVTAEASR